MRKVILITTSIILAISAYGQDNNNKSQTSKSIKMASNTVNASIKINAAPTQVWEVLTNPKMITQFTGSKVETNWKVGSPITWSGQMQGTPYTNKGEVLEVEPNNLLRHSFWTGIGGDADIAENYSEVMYSITRLDEDVVELMYSRKNIATEMEAEMFQQHIQSMLEEIKRLSEE